LASPKIQDGHLTRLAIVYVRQSTPQQVLEHRASRERQYALADVAVALGWPRDRVLVIDEDQGQSGKTAQDRAGFQRLVAEVTMNHVGLILGLEMSRLARSNGDWHHLFEWCAVFQTLLADQDGVYDANSPDDRLILGLKGMMSEVEQITMRNRLDRGRLYKATRGELWVNVPMGYLQAPDAEPGMDPDAEVQAVTRALFDKLDELGSVRAVFRYLVANNLRLGYRVRGGPRRGQLEWRRASPSGLYFIFRNPAYAGAYAYGRRPRDPRRPGKSVSRPLPMAEWKVLLRDRLPAYITWERYLANQERLRQNRTAAGSSGVPRQGAALLAGLLVCGRCGRRLGVAYRANGRAQYTCRRHLEEGTPPTCSGLVAVAVDELVAAQVLKALEPAALELSLQAVEAIDKERGRHDQHWRQRLERARYEAERAERQYQAVEPTNRLVARTLEQRWEEALQAEARIQEDYNRFARESPPRLGAAGRDRIRSLSEEVPALWQAPGTTATDRKEVVRCLIERVVVHVCSDSEQVAVTIHWQGGSVSEHHGARPVRRYDQLADLEGLLDRIAQLRREGHTTAAIATRLNEEGYRMPKQRGLFTAGSVQELLSRRGLAHEKRDTDQLGRDEWWLGDLAEKLEMPPLKLRDWLLRGWLHGRQTPAQGLWIVWADREEVRRLRKLRTHSRRGRKGYPAAWTTPKARPKK
jgi:DNA invertase Pin-like site-specific DNA recombinase